MNKRIQKLFQFRMYSSGKWKTKEPQNWWSDWLNDVQYNNWRCTECAFIGATCKRQLAQCISRMSSPLPGKECSRNQSLWHISWRPSAVVSCQHCREVVNTSCDCGALRKATRLVLWHHWEWPGSDQQDVEYLIYTLSGYSATMELIMRGLTYVGMW